MNERTTYTDWMGRSGCVGEYENRTSSCVGRGLGRDALCNARVKERRRRRVAREDEHVVQGQTQGEVAVALGAWQLGHRRLHRQGDEVGSSI
eukprot:365362-Chlamydomonas_euryale.AAC.25